MVKKTYNDVLKNTLVSTLRRTLEELRHNQLTPIKIKGALDNYYTIDGIELSSDGYVMIVSNELSSDLEDALGADL